MNNTKHHELVLAKKATPGSLVAMAGGKKNEIANVFYHLCTHIVVVDTSGSMDWDDAGNGRRRIDVARDHLKRLQGENPGKIAVIEFNDDVIMRPNGIISTDGTGGTYLVKAIDLLAEVDEVGLTFILITDGEPFNPEESLEKASRLKSKLHCIYAGPEDGDGRQFMRQLSQVAQSKFATTKTAGHIYDPISKLMLTDKKGG